MKIDLRNRLFVSGGPAGNGRVVDAATGRILASYTFNSAGTSFINDVILTPSAAWFTDSFNAVLYKVPLGPGGQLPPQSAVASLPLTGDFVLGDGFNANGIARTPDGHALIIVQSNTGLLLRVDTATGVARTVNVGGATFANGDGILLVGNTLFVVQNVLNTVVAVRLNPAGTSGTVGASVTDPRFDVPTTVAVFGDRLYLPNARFTTPPTPSTVYTANAIRKP